MSQNFRICPQRAEVAKIKEDKLGGFGISVLYFQMTETHDGETENALHPIGQNFLVQCVGYRGLAYRNKDGRWKSIFGNKTLPKKISFLPSVQTSPPASSEGQAAPG
jgi:hypothetical protein